MEASADLIARARTSRAAFGELYWHYCPKVYRYFLAHTGNHHDSEDLTAQTFEQVLRTIDRYEDRGNRFSTWLLTVASHVLLAQIRQRGRGMLGDKALLTVDERTSGPETDPAQMAEIWERATWWDSILSTLTPIQETAVRARYVEDRSLDDVSRLIDRSPTATRQILHRGIVSLRERLAQREGTFDDDQPRAPRKTRERV